MNYTLNSIKINSNWFDDDGRKKSVYSKIGYKGLNLYFQLYKFRLHRQDDEHTFMTSIAYLRKETGYTTDEVFDLLKKLKSAKVIKMNNYSRWDYLLDNGQVKDKELLHITALDAFPIQDYKKEDNRFYIYVPLDLFNIYQSKGLNEKYYALYCLIEKWSQNRDDKMYMSIGKMATVLGFDKDYVNKMIHEMNRNYLLASRRRKRTDRQGYRFEHYILNTTKKDKVDTFMVTHKETMDKFAKKTIEES